jgi:hypothetical protein
MGRMIRFFTILFLLSVACFAQVKQWHLTNTTGNVQTQINNRLRIDGGTNILSAKLTIEGGLTNDVEFGDIARLDLDSTDASLSGVASIYIDGGITTLRGLTNLQVITPGVFAGSAAVGQFLKLTDANDGTVEFAPVSTATGSDLEILSRYQPGISARISATSRPVASSISAIWKQSG